MHPKTLVYGSPDTGVVNLIRNIGGSRAGVVLILKSLHSQYGQLTPHLGSEGAQELTMPPSRVHGIATFYSLLTRPVPTDKTIRVCEGSFCMMRGASELTSKIQAQMDESWTVTPTSCLGLCDRAPAALVRRNRVGPLRIWDLDRYVAGWCGEVAGYRLPRPGETRVLLPDPAVENDLLEIAFAGGSYPALKKALRTSPEKTLNELEISGLRGRGGAGFPAGYSEISIFLDCRMGTI
jgi:NADH:ubiquinone oxidoreductase subunit E